MRAAALLVASVVALAACDERPPIEPVELSLRVQGAPGEVPLGRGFRLTAVRVWDKRLAPEPWDEQALAPLSARLVGTSRREDDRRAEETRVWLCHAFETGRVEVPALSFTAAPPGGGPAKTVRSEPTTLRVTATLDATAPGAVEWPEGPLDEPRRWIPWALTSLALLGGAGLVASRRRRPLPVPPAPAPPAESACSKALRGIAALRGCEDAAAVAAQISRILRTFLSEDAGVPANERTTEELAASHLGGLSEPVRRNVTDVLTHGDRVKFAKLRPSREETARILDAAEAAVREGGHPAEDTVRSAAS